ncbi:hypothetical protein BRARA_A00623 [Brassica rapa]|uniref:Cytochrome P450 n=1 Tax=Brassica campestris TaxID=3711 RepID=A0A398AQ51_BRACM|nr:hypothetical protein BRARA_A00623 [Brassica rapa]
MFIFLCFSCVFLLLTFVSLICFVKKIKETKTLNLPPSPPSFPIIGNLHQLAGLPHRCFHHLSIKYGPVVLLHLGSVPTVVISSSEAAEEVLRIHDLGCCNRPKTVATRKLSYGFKDISFAQYGEYWREMRKLAVIELFSLKKVHSFKNIREEEIGFMVKKVSQLSLEHTPVDLSKTFFSLTASIICRVALGQNFNESGFVIEQDRIEELVRDALVALGTITCSDLFPSGLGRFLDSLSGGHKSINKVVEELDAFYQHRWTDPEEFIPERFANSSVDFRGQHFDLLPFGSGRRSCPGMPMALASVELGLLSLLYFFDWALPEGMVSEEDIDMEEAGNLTIVKKQPLLLVPVRHH